MFSEDYFSKNIPLAHSEVSGSQSFSSGTPSGKALHFSISSLCPPIRLEQRIHFGRENIDGSVNLSITEFLFI